MGSPGEPGLTVPSPEPDAYAARTVLITGGGTGLGAAMAVHLAKHGYAVHVAGRRHAPLATVVAAVGSVGGRAQAHVLDVRDAERCRAVVDAVVVRQGRLDVLVNNAGVFRRGTPSAVSADDWALTVDVNLTGALNAAQAAVAQMRRQSSRDGARGQLVNVNSGAGLRAYVPGAAYTASKFGLMGLSAALRDEVASDLIKVTDLVVATSVESDLSGRVGVRRLPAMVVARALHDLLAMPGSAVVSRLDVEQLPVS